MDTGQLSKEAIEKAERERIANLIKTELLDSMEKEFFGMKYPIKECARPALIKRKLCLDCSVERFCEAPEKIEIDRTNDYIKIPTGGE